VTGDTTRRVAAIQLRPELGNVEANLEKASALVRRAFSEGATWVVLPEFFTTGIVFDDSLLAGHQPLRGAPMQLLAALAAEGEAAVGGSYLAESDGHVRNTFVLATADGQVFTHDKDFPSGPIEHAYYVGGEDAEFVSILGAHGISVGSPPVAPRTDNDTDGVFRLPHLNVGVALCWEMIRRRTVARLRNRIDLVCAGSAWPDIDPDLGFPGMTRAQIVELNETLVQMLRDAPCRLAKLLGVPVIHANLVGPVRATKLFDLPVKYATRFCGESVIVDARGAVIARRPAADGEGVVVADLHLEKTTPEKADGNDFWISELPPTLKDLWYNQGAVGREYYLRQACPSRRANRG
jgi:predicted amidohydrolase